MSPVQLPFICQDGRDEVFDRLHRERDIRDGFRKASILKLFLFDRFSRSSILECHAVLGVRGCDLISSGDRDIQFMLNNLYFQAQVLKV